MHPDPLAGFEHTSEGKRRGERGGKKKEEREG